MIILAKCAKAKRGHSGTRASNLSVTAANHNCSRVEYRTRQFHTDPWRMDESLVKSGKDWPYMRGVKILDILLHANSVNTSRTVSTLKIQQIRILKIWYKCAIVPFLSEDCK